MFEQVIESDGELIDLVFAFFGLQPFVEAGRADDLDIIDDLDHGGQGDAGEQAAGEEEDEDRNEESDEHDEEELALLVEAIGIDGGGEDNEVAGVVDIIDADDLPVAFCVFDGFFSADLVDDGFMPLKGAVLDEDGLVVIVIDADDFFG